MKLSQLKSNSIYEFIWNFFKSRLDKRVGRFIIQKIDTFEVCIIFIRFASINIVKLCDSIGSYLTPTYLFCIINSHKTPYLKLRTYSIFHQFWVLLLHISIAQKTIKVKFNFTFKGCPQIAWFCSRLVILNIFDDILS